ncbi:MAG: macro domain-containing protein [Gemmataceae bacterium]|nr:macro domain-containing protein [Gemmataceae bacterium]
MNLKVKLVDVNPAMVEAWRDAFVQAPQVEIIHASMLTQSTDAWVSPTNSRGSMDGGLDGVIKSYLGNAIEKKLQSEIKKHHKGSLPVGHATCIPTGKKHPTYLISTPTISTPYNGIAIESINVALACAAVFYIIQLQNKNQPDSITSVAIPGLGTNTGQVPVDICANLMWLAYDLMRCREFSSVSEMKEAIEEQYRLSNPHHLTDTSSEVAPIPQADASS